MAVCRVRVSSDHVDRILTYDSKVLSVSMININQRRGMFSQVTAIVFFVHYLPELFIGIIGILSYHRK